MKCLIKIPNIKYGSSLRYGCGPYMTLKLGQVHVFTATLPGTVYGSLSHEYHYLIPRTTLTVTIFYIQN